MWILVLLFLHQINVVDVFTLKGENLYCVLALIHQPRTSLPCSSLLLSYFTFFIFFPSFLLHALLLHHSITYRLCFFVVVVVSVTGPLGDADLCIAFRELLLTNARTATADIFPESHSIWHQHDSAYRRPRTGCAYHIRDFIYASFVLGPIALYQRRRIFAHPAEGSGIKFPCIVSIVVWM